MDAAEGLAELGTDEARALLKALAVSEDELGALCKELLIELAVADAKLIGTPTNLSTTEVAPDRPAEASSPAEVSSANAGVKPQS